MLTENEVKLEDGTNLLINSTVKPKDLKKTPRPSERDISLQEDTLKTDN